MITNKERMKRFKLNNPDWRERHRKACQKWNKQRIMLFTYTEKKKDADFLRKIRARNYTERHPELKNSQCEICGSTENLNGHHPDYDYPEIFVTCCSSCHMYIHKGID